MPILILQTSVRGWLLQGNFPWLSPCCGLNVCFPPPKIHILKHWATMWWLGLWKVVRFRWGWGPHKGICVFIRKGRGQSSLSLLHGKMQWQGSHLQPGKGSSPDTWIGWYFDYGLLSFQSCEKQVSVGSATSSMVFCCGSSSSLRHFPSPFPVNLSCYIFFKKHLY